jgi:hypothetical protein
MLVDPALMHKYGNVPMMQLAIVHDQKFVPVSQAIPPCHCQRVRAYDNQIQSNKLFH